MKRLAIILVLFLFLAGSPCTVDADGPNVHDFIISDVTPVSFSVIWIADEPALPTIKVFSDPEGQNDNTSQLQVSSFPTRNGDSSIALSAKSAGIMKIRVSGLNPNTTYYFQTVTKSESTLEITYYPETEPFMTVYTENEVSRTTLENYTNKYFSNDLLKIDNCYLPDGHTPAKGTLVIATTDQADYPVSAFVGDGIDDTLAYIDLNNFFHKYSGNNFYLDAGTKIIITRFMGTNGILIQEASIPANTKLAKITTVAPPLCEGDLAAPFGVVDSDDLEIFANDFGTALYEVPADLDGDGDVDGVDLSCFAADFDRNDCPIK